MRLVKVIGEPPDRVIDMAYADAERLLRAGQAEPADDSVSLPEDLRLRFAPVEVAVPETVAEVQRPRFGRRHRR